MSYDTTLGAWTKSYSFRIHDPLDPQRNLGDSVYQYKFNQGGGSGGWYSDPLNPEQNAADNNNSVLRMSRFFWFEYYGAENTTQVTRISAMIGHANSDSITSVMFKTAASQSSPLTTTDVTAFYNPVTRILDFTAGLPVAKTNYFRLVAFNNLGDSIVYSRGGYVISVMPMPSYAQHAVTLPSVASNDSVTFRLRVSGKSYVLLRIAPLGQPVSNATPIVMRKAPNPADWWINVKLAPGTYEYVYEIENGKQIYDPWGRYNGVNGSRFTVGPEGLTADNYVWNTIGYQRPPRNKLVIYELNIGEFAGGYYGKPGGQATFSDLATLLLYFDSLGVNALELMPVTDYQLLGQSGFSWGYDLSSFLSLEPAYGTPAQFKALVDSAHAHGIAIILDVVYNHLNDPAALWQMQPDEATNPYFKNVNDLRPNEDNIPYFKDLDHWTPETQEIVYTALKMWIDVYKVDGFRYDYTQGIGWSTGDTTKGILGWSNRIRNEYNDSVYQIVEHLPESPALIYYSGINAGWHDSYRDEIFDEARYKSTSLTEFENLIIGLGAYPGNDLPAVPATYANRTEPVNGNVNHDEQSLIYEMTNFQSVPLNEAIQRDKLYATFMFTSLGIPMLWQGMEFSEPRGWNDEGQKLAYRPVDWDLYPTVRGQSHYQYYHKLIQQRKFNPALYNGTLRKLYRYDSPKVLVWGFEDAGTGAKVMAVANMSGAERTVSSVPWLGTGTWYDIFTQNQFIAADTIVASVTISPYSALVYSNRSDSALGIITSVEEYSQQLPTEFTLSQNYPNPFNPETNFHFEIPVTQAGINTPQFVSLKVYDVMGREVSSVLSRELLPGSYTVPWNAGKLASGVYFYRLSTASGSYARKMMLLR
jgi:1,4-alpha-glucan branching enzyme